jgi:hypothetical protein
LPAIEPAGPTTARQRATPTLLGAHRVAHLFDVTLLSPAEAFYNPLEAYNLGPFIFGRLGCAPEVRAQALAHSHGRLWHGNVSFIPGTE